jgi:uncharacterized membrane protein YhhN
MMPFAGGIDSLSNGTLLLACTAAAVYLPMQARAPSWRRTVAKTAGVALLAVLAIIEQGPWLLVAALALSAVGDACLAHDGERPFLAGLASFLAGHLAYLALFVAVGQGLGLLTAEPWRLALDAVVTLAALLLLRRLFPAVGTDLRVPVGVYVAAILAMMFAASTVADPLVVGGAALFVVSDAILATQKFLLREGSRHHAWAGPAVWVLYFLAQTAITLGLLL